MPIPFEPEPLDSLRSRFPGAMAHVYDTGGMARGAIRPEEVRANVFDFPSGVRVIVSRDRMPWGGVVAHAVSYPFAGYFAGRGLSPSAGEALAKFRDDASAALASLCDVPFRPLGFAPPGAFCFCWVCDE